MKNLAATLKALIDEQTAEQMADKPIKIIFDGAPATFEVDFTREDHNDHIDLVIDYSELLQACVEFNMPEIDEPYTMANTGCVRHFGGRS